MKIQEAITKCDELKPNQYEPAQKISWLNELDEKIWNEVINSREIETDEEGNPLITFNGYDNDTDVNTTLLADAYTELYIYYLMSKIDFYNAETARYNISAAMFNEAYAGYTGSYYRAHRQPRGHVPKSI